MSPTAEQLKQFGWDDWFAAQAEARGLAKAHLARVVAVDREQLLVIDASGEFRAKLAGRLLHSAGQPGDFPCVGDWVSLLERRAIFRVASTH